MKLPTLAVLLAITVSGPVLAQKTAADVTVAQVAEYKAAAQKACIDGGEKQGDPRPKVEAFCICLIQTLTKGMTAADWQRAYYFSQTEQIEEERKIIEPHLEKLDACREEPQAGAAQR